MVNSHILSTRQVAERLGVSTQTVYSYIWAGLLKAYKLGGQTKGSRYHWRIEQRDLDKFLRQNGNGNSNDRPRD